MAKDGIETRRAGAWSRVVLVALAVLALVIGTVACGDGGPSGGESERWDTAVWGSARWAP